MKGLADRELKNRLQALKNLIQKNPKKIENGWINLHVHTNESFSVFKSPTEAVWHAYNEDIEYFGINDHYTIDGHDEFRAACKIAHLRATFSIEAIAMNAHSLNNNRRFNDPDNPGRVYLVGKGVTRNLRVGSKGYMILNTMRNAIQERNRRIVKKLNDYAADRGYSLNMSYDDVKALTPNGNATERHVVQAFCEKIDGITRDQEERREIYKKLLNSSLDKKTLMDPAGLQTIVRAKLIKSGKPCYVEEDKEAFTSMEDLIDIYLEFGAVPSYPLMGNPITEEEEDLEGLVAKAKRYHLYAFDMFEFRTEEERSKEIVDVASYHGFPVFIGTEHNTKKMTPLTGKIVKNPELYGYLKKSAQFVLGHQILSKLCNYGHINSEGKPVIDNLKEGFQLFANTGAMDLSEAKIEELTERGMKERKSYFGVN